MEQDETTHARCDVLHRQIVAAMKELMRLHQCDRIVIPIDGSSPQLYIATGTAHDLVHHGRLMITDAAHSREKSAETRRQAERPALTSRRPRAPGRAAQG